MARYDDMMFPPGMDDDDSDDEIGGSAQHKAKPRRKSHQRPQGSDQIRQAFSKRKKGLVLKAYQLNALTDAKVFMFIVNDKGTSWAYATPGFSNTLNPDLLKQLRALAHVPEQAKLITEVMPDPPNAKHPADITAASEHAAARRGDQVPGNEAPCTRTATGAIPARSRSSYSGGGSAGDGNVAGAACDPLPLARTGSTTTTRMPSTMLSDEHSPTKPRARPLSGSSIAGGARPGSAVAHSQYLQQQRQQGGKLLGMEPPTPCGMYNLLGQPVAANDSPTVVSDMVTSCPSPSSNQNMLAPDVLAGARLAAAINSAAACGMPITISQGMEQQDCWRQQEPTGLQWLAPQDQQQQQQGGYSWQMNAYQQQQLQQQYQPCQQAAVMGGSSADGWCAVEVKPQPFYAVPGGNADISNDCQQHVMRMCSATNSGMGAPGAQQQQHVLSSSAPTGYSPASAEGGAAGTQQSFDNMLRGLPPLRVSRQQQPKGDWREPDGAHSAPAGAVRLSALGGPQQWMEFEVQPEVTRQLSDVACYASSSGYSSYVASPSYANQQQQQPSGTNASSPVDGQGAGPAVTVGSGPSSIAGLIRWSRDGSSADASPAAALSNQLCTVLAVESPVHPSAEQSQQMQAGYAHQQQMESSLNQSRGPVQQLQHNQGAFIPRTDDLVLDPLMDMLMDQAIGGGRTGSSSGTMPGMAGTQQQQQQGQQHMSIMEATLQQQPIQQRQQYINMVQPQRYLQQHSARETILQGQQQDQLSQVSSLLQHIPLPPKSDADKPAWQEHVRQLLSSLQLQPQQHQQLMALIRERTQGGMSCGASNTCSPALPPGGGSMSAAAMQPHQQLLSSTSSGMAYASRMSSQQYGGKQRHGPSRLSATSPAIDATATGTECSGLQSTQGLQGSYMQPDAVAGAAAVQYMSGSGTGALPMVADVAMQAMSCPMPVSLAMGTATGAGYAVQAVCGSTAAEGAYCSMAQMMPMPMSMQSAISMQSKMTHEYELPVQAEVPPGAATTICAPVAISRAAASDPASAPLQQQQPAPGLVGNLLADLQQTRSACSSPLKRCTPSAPFSAAAGLMESDDAMSPLKRACRDLPEPPSFATLLQTEFSEDDAVAWAASAAANDSLKSLKIAATLGSCGSFLKFDSLSKLDSGSGSLAAFVTVSGSEAAAAQLAAAEGSSGAMLQQLAQEEGGQAEQGPCVEGDTVMGEVVCNAVANAASSGAGAAGDETCGGGDTAAAAAWDKLEAHQESTQAEQG